MAPTKWVDGEAYEQFIGKWSRDVAPRFLEWVAIPAGARVLDAGCGPGALTEALLARGASAVVGVDLSPEFVALASRRVKDPRARFAQADIQALPEPDASFDAAVSGLVLNFAPDPARAAAELVRVTRPGGTVGAYLWDLGGKMEILRAFWDAAVKADPEGAGPLDEGVRFPLCKPRPMAELFRGAGLERVATVHIDIPTVFPTFDDYWRSFSGGQGPAPGYAATLASEGLTALREALRDRVAPGGDGPLNMIARAFAVRGTVPQKAKPSKPPAAPAPAKAAPPARTKAPRKAKARRKSR